MNDDYVHNLKSLHGTAIPEGDIQNNSFSKYQKGRDLLNKLTMEVEEQITSHYVLELFVR